jgi:hypothetical protein
MVLLRLFRGSEVYAISLQCMLTIEKKENFQVIRSFSLNEMKLCCTGNGY